MLLPLTWTIVFRKLVLIKNAYFTLKATTVYFNAICLDEDIYKLDTKDDDTIEKLNDILGKPMLTVSGLETDSSETKAMKEQMMSNLPKEMTPNGDIDIFQVFSMMPKEQLTQVKAEFDEQFSEMPDSIISQAAVSYVKGCLLYTSPSPRDS